MSIKKVFKTTIPSVNYVTQKGRTCVFVEGRYLTDVPEEIAELSKVCEDKSSIHIYVDPDESEIDTTVQERVAAAARKAALAELEKINQEKNAGSQSGAQTSAQVPQSATPAQMLGVATSLSNTNMPQSNSSAVKK